MKMKICILTIATNQYLQFVEKLYDDAMRNSYAHREVWDKPQLIGVVQGVVNWFDPRLGNDMEYSRKKYNID